MNTAEIIVMLICGGSFSALIGSLVGAAILRAAAKRVEDLELPFGGAYATTLFTYLIYLMIAVPVAVAVDATDPGLAARVGLHACWMIVAFLIQSGMVSICHGVSCAKGARIAGWMWSIWLLFAVVIVAIGFMASLFMSR